VVVVMIVVGIIMVHRLRRRLDHRGMAAIEDQHRRAGQK
jgi:hypothetical protein